MPAPATVLHVSPHPDDEAIGAPATLQCLRAAGHRVVSYAVGLGRPADHERRRAELERSARRAGIELLVREPPLAISGGDDLAAARDALTASLAELLARTEFDLVVSPSPHDGHHGHELVGRAVRDALARDGAPSAWWMWGIWADLPLPTLLVPFGRPRMLRVAWALAAYRGELRRNDYLALAWHRSGAQRVLGPERVFGFGAKGQRAPYAELLTEALRVDGAWLAGDPRVLEPRTPLGPRAGTRPLGWWLDEASFRDRLRAESGIR